MKSSVEAYGLSVQRHDDVSRNFGTFIESHGMNMVAEAAIRRSVPVGLYEHWKSAEDDQKFYVVHGVSLEKDKHTPHVIFTSLYGQHAGKLTSLNLLDHEDGFLTPINKDVYRGPRFEKIVELSRKEIDILLQYIGELRIHQKRSSFGLAIRNLLKARNLPI